jgi:putative Mg2+ transporter-C (MgtC) family protein
VIPIGSVALRAGQAAALNGEGWRQAAELGLALVLSAAIGLEREIRQKNAGLRTHTLVGVGAALFMLISKYGFTDVLQPRLVVLDPSRVAAQIVTGIGFLGAGLIFVRRDSVRGLTTAAAVWVTAAVGAASGAGLPVLAALTTGAYFLVALGFPAVTRRLPKSATAISALRVRYPDGRGILRNVLAEATTRGFAIDDVQTEALGPRALVVRAGRICRGPDGRGQAARPRQAVGQRPGRWPVRTGRRARRPGQRRQRHRPVARKHRRLTRMARLRPLLHWKRCDHLVANQCQVGLWRSLEQVGGLEQSGADARSRWRCCIWALYGFATRRCACAV